MSERNHDAPAIKVLTPMGMVKYTQRQKTHATYEEAAPDSSGGHINNDGSTTIVPSKGAQDDNLPSVNLESEAPSPGLNVGGHGRMIKDATSVLTAPSDPHEQYFKPKYASKVFSGRIRF